MKITVVDAYYPSFLRSFASNHPELTGCSYSEGHTSLMAAHFAESDAYSYHLRRLGHDADEIIVNADFLQASRDAPGSYACRIPGPYHYSVVSEDRPSNYR